MIKESKSTKSVSPKTQDEPAKEKAAKVKPAKIKPLHCPTCKKLVKASDEDFPFCSDRCRRIDLGKWAMGVYKVSSPVLDPETAEDSLLEGRSEDVGGGDYGSGRGR